MPKHFDVLALLGFNGPKTISPGSVKMDAFSWTMSSAGASSIQISCPDIFACYPWLSKQR